MSWLDIPNTLAALLAQSRANHRQVQRLYTETIRRHRETREEIMAVGTKVLAALSKIDEAITTEADDLADFVAKADQIDDETSALILERVARIKAIVPEKAPEVGDAADDGTAQAPADLPDAEAQTPPAVDGTDADGNADVPGDGVNGETGTAPTA